MQLIIALKSIFRRQEKTINIQKAWRKLSLNADQYLVYHGVNYHLTHLVFSVCFRAWGQFCQLASSWHILQVLYLRDMIWFNFISEKWKGFLTCTMYMLVAHYIHLHLSHTLMNIENGIFLLQLRKMDLSKILEINLVCRHVGYCCFLNKWRWNDGNLPATYHWQSSLSS